MPSVPLEPLVPEEPLEPDVPEEPSLPLVPEEPSSPELPALANESHLIESNGGALPELPSPIFMNDPPS